MLNKIKQWVYQKLANRLLRAVIIAQMNEKGYDPGYILHGSDWGWNYIVPKRLIRKQTPVPYVAQYDIRTEAEHAAIRKSIQKNPDTCLHLKGGRVPGPSVDYNISCFTFINGSTQIKCLSCRRVWTPGSPDWKEAQRMVSNSTNTPNSCEVRYRVNLGK